MLFLIVIIFAAFIIYLYIIDKMLRKKELKKLSDAHNILRENKKLNNIPDCSYLVRINPMTDIENSENVLNCNKYKSFYIWKKGNNLYLQEVNTQSVEKNHNNICLSVNDILFFEISEEKLTDDELLEFIKSNHSNTKRPIARKIETIIKDKEKANYISQNKKIYVYYLDNKQPKAISLISKNYNTLKNLIPDKELRYLEENKDKNSDDIIQIIKELHALKENDIISEAEFSKHKERLLEKI